MSAFSTKRRLISAYAESESWKNAHAQAMHCRDLEEDMAWGVKLFRGLVEAEARLQALNLKGRMAADDPVWPEIDECYRAWTAVSGKILAEAERLAAIGFAVEGSMTFRATLEEAWNLLGNMDLEGEIRPFEELAGMAKPENPRPERYAD